MEGPDDRIVPLNELDDFEVAEGDPDVRGWPVIASDGRRIGDVEQLLVDPAAMRVRYLDVALDEARPRHVLVPIGSARVLEEGSQVQVDRLTSAELIALPEYSRPLFTAEYEVALRQRFGPETDATYGIARHPRRI